MYCCGPLPTCLMRAPALALPAEAGWTLAALIEVACLPEVAALMARDSRPLDTAAYAVTHARPVVRTTAVPRPPGSFEVSDMKQLLRVVAPAEVRPELDATSIPRESCTAGAPSPAGPANMPRLGRGSQYVARLNTQLSR
jgi:hypothetical protein